MKIPKSALALCLLVGTATGASADGFRDYGKICGGNNTAFQTCASVGVSVTGTLVSITVQNLSGLYGSYANTVFTGIGLYNVPWAVDIPNGVTTATVIGPASPYNTGTPPSTWLLTNNKQIGGGINLDLVTYLKGVNGSIASNCADPAMLPSGANQLYMTNACSGPANYVTFTFNVTQTWDPSQTQLLVKGQNGLNGQSIECITGTNCSAPPPPPSTVPEPVSTVLLGTGLFGVALPAWRRRRQQRAA